MKTLEAPNKTCNYYIPTRTLFGAGCLEQLHTLELPGKKAMICTTGEAFYKDLGYLDAIERELKAAGVDFCYFDQIVPNPPVECVMAGGAVARENKVDFLISLGGGGCHDCAKSIAVAATNDRNIWDYVSGGTAKGLPLDAMPIPLVCINTTAGTGSQVNCGSVINNLQTKEKLAISKPVLFPTLCIEDANLMTSVPPKLTAAQGFDAFDHCLEGFLSVKANMFSDMYAITGIEHSARYLARCVRNGNDLEARDHLAFASHLGGRVIVTCGSVGLHGLEHAMSAYYEKLPHGIGLALVAHEYFKVYVDRHQLDERFIRVAKAMGYENASKAGDFIDALDKFMEDIGLDQVKMSDYGITPNDFEKFDAKGKGTLLRLFQNDVSFLETGDVIGILERSYK